MLMPKYTLRYRHFRAIFLLLMPLRRYDGCHILCLRDTLIPCCRRRYAADAAATLQDAMR